MKTFALVSLAFFISCARLTGIPSYHTMKKQGEGFELPGKPKQGEGTVYVVRPTNIGHEQPHRFKVYLGNVEASKEMGRNYPEEYIYFYVPAGDHTVITVGEMQDQISFSLKEGENVFIQQVATPGYTKLRLKLKLVDENEGRFFVKKTELGKVIRERP